jgi:membrane-bound inhibitor of C-type lysozyme
MKTIGIIALVALVAVLGWVTVQHRSTPAVHVRATSTPFAEVTYQCDGGKRIEASYFEGVTQPPSTPNGPPVPGGSVALTLSDGRSLMLAQTISADGIRYSDGDPAVANGETFVFWSKGNGALVLEHGSDQTYTGCIKIAPDPGGLPEVYESGSNGFSIRYPEGYTVDEAYVYQARGPGKDIHGVKFTIPSSVATGTNLAEDTYLSVEEIPDVPACSANLFLDVHSEVSTVTEGDTTYEVASTTDAAAGNRYEEAVYAIPGSNPCMAVRYSVHYGVLENYPPGLVHGFDRQQLLSGFNAIRSTLVR